MSEYTEIRTSERKPSSVDVEAACARALRSRATTYRSVKSILEHALDRLPLEEEQITLALPTDHAHVRGSTYYATLTSE